jgi:hypothetical protein
MALCQHIHRISEESIKAKTTGSEKEYCDTTQAQQNPIVHENQTNTIQSHEKRDKHSDDVKNAATNKDRSEKCDDCVDDEVHDIAFLVGVGFD